MGEDRDRRILENLMDIAGGIGQHFGSDCEVVIHDLRAKNPEETICYIVNGQVSGRQIGDGPSAVVLEAIRRLEDGKSVDDRICYLSRTRDGRVLKSSTMFVRGGDGAYRYLFGINYDITRLVHVEEGLRGLISIPQEREEEDRGREIPNSVNELLDSLIAQSVALIGKQPALMTKDEKVRAIRFLNDAGAFLITKSGDKVSSFFGISKFTLYSYIDVNKRKS